MKRIKLHNQIITIGEQQYQVQHEYDVPYERNDLLLKMRIEQDARNPETKMEPPLFMTLYADIDYEYNYYASTYEHFSRETLRVGGYFFMPCLNDFLLKQAGIFPNTSDYVKLMTLMYQAYPNAESLSGKVLSKEYFETYATKANMLFLDKDNHSEHILEEYFKIREKYMTEYISKTSMEIYKDVENKREMFPFFTKINIEGIRNSQFANLIEEAGLCKMFVDFIDSMAGKDRNEVVYKIKMVDTEGRISGGSEDNIEKNVPCSTLSQFYDYVESADEGKTYSSAGESKTYCEFLEGFVKTKILRDKIDKLFALVLSEDKPFHNEVIAYKVTKYMPSAEDADLRDLHSTFYFFNFQDMQNFKYYDTAVTYRGKYRYEISVINAIVAPPRSAGDPDLVFMVEPYYSEDIFIIDSPPIAPDIQLLTYRGVDNKVLILFNSMVDKAADVPIYIRSDDEGIFQDQYIAQNIQKPAPIIFESDDPTNFEMFKTLEKPLKYSEFNNTYYRFIDSSGLTSAAYIDNILPNTKYYYIFRASDIHGYLSNPTPIYEFEIKKDGETMYPVIRIVDFKEMDPPVQKTKSFKQYLKIGFAPSQYQIPVNKIVDINNSLHNKDVDIGISGDNIIGTDRKFKFRIRSKNTGKLIDLNVTYKKNKAIKV